MAKKEVSSLANAVGKYLSKVKKEREFKKGVKKVIQYNEHLKDRTKPNPYAKKVTKKLPYVGTALTAYETGKAAYGAVKRVLANKAGMKPAKKSKGSANKNFDNRLKRK